MGSQRWYRNLAGFQLLPDRSSVTNYLNAKTLIGLRAWHHEDAPSFPDTSCNQKTRLERDLRTKIDLEKIPTENGQDILWL